MIAGSAGRRYAKALFSIGEENGNLIGLLRDVQRMADIWSESDELRSTMTNPLIDIKGKRKIWNEIISQLGISIIGKNFFGLLFDKSRFADLPGIARELGVLTDKKDNRLRAEITSATPLSESRVGQLKAALQRRTGKVVVVTKRVDPMLIGGIVTKVGDLMYDGSIRTELARMKEAMLGQE